MDERHWWIAGKIQESFHIGGYDNPTLLEDFMCEPETLEMINQFLQPGGPCRVFFYCDKPESGTLSTRQLHITGSLANLRDVDLDQITILYFLRHDVDSEVPSTNMEKSVFCGELKGNTVENLNSLLADIYVPLLRAQKDWGQCTDENQMLLMHNLDKFLSALSESSGSSHSSKQWMLKHPENLVSNDFKQHRLAALDQSIISEYEELVSDWIGTIEAILHDTSDERFMDPNAGPLSELERWRRRQRLLTSITEQLKSKECKGVIGVLITAKSRLLKRWKLIDSGITDAMNETKDKVKYLESLKRHLDQLYNGATPSSIINSALPGLINSVKQMDSISRFYARGGFLGLLFTKVTNQMVLACKDFIKECTLTDEDEDLLWDRVEEEVLSRDLDKDGTVPGLDPIHRHLRSHVESRLSRAKINRGKTREGKDPKMDGETLFARMKACLTLQNHYREALRSLRDTIGGSHNMSHFGSLSSLGVPQSVTGRSRLSTLPGSKQGPRTSVSTSPSKKTPSMAGDQEGHGVSIADEETIMAHMDLFCSRIRQVLDVINTMASFYKMVRTTAGLPRPRKEDLVYDESKEDKKKPDDDFAETPGVSIKPPATSDHNLMVIAEDEDEKNEADEKGDGQKDGMSEHADEVHDVVNTSSGLTKEDVLLLKKYYPDHKKDDGPSITHLVKQHVNNMTSIMTESVTTNTVLDVESKDQERFEDIYTNFLMVVQELEKFLGAYLHAIFVRKMRTHEGLEMMTRFVPIQHRPGIRVVISEKFVEIFNWYEGDLEEIQMIYEKHKENPPLLRNAPPVAGVIHWSRQLLKRIEDPMKVFRENRAITHLKDFSRIVKIYNRLATALVTFESLWFTHWKTHIDHAKNGLRATLFVHHPDTKEIMVNADDKVLELIHEARWLTRLGIQIPESAHQVMMQEGRFKSYKDHLELCLLEFKQVYDAIPNALQGLFKSHVDAALQNFQPGLSTLAWNSMNIDAFLHQIHTGTAKLRLMVERINDIMRNKVEGTIEKIQEMFLFDYKLAFSRSWPPPEFSDAMITSIKHQSQQLYDYVTAIESGIREIANILTNRKSTDTTFHQASREKTKSSSDITPNMKIHSKEDQMVVELLKYYCDQIFDAIRVATTRTLVTLAESCGCDGEVIRTASALSDIIDQVSRTHSRMSDSPSPRSGSPSRAASAMSQEGRPVSVLSMLSNMTWTTEKSKEDTYLQFEVSVKFNIPNIIIEPNLESIQTAINVVARTVLSVVKDITWLGAESFGESFLQAIQQDECIDQMMGQLSTVVEDLTPVVKQHMFHFSNYDFLWKDDMQGNYYEFINHEPGVPAIKREVERLLKIEKKVVGIPKILPVGPICLHTDPIKDALHGFAMAWKTQYASVLHEEAKKKLDAAVLYRSNVRQRLELTVTNLDQLNSTLHLLEELRDMENKIDDIYLPIETMYDKLREFELRLPRNEVEEVDSLRDNWQELLALAEDVRVVLLKERGGAFEQELDKQVKTFVVEVIQFRNAFDAQGPAVPGIPPSEAVSRLQDFHQRCTLYDAKRKTLDSVSRLFGIPCKPFPELDKTSEELELLGMLYGLFQKFIRFDVQFRDSLWAEVDLDESTREVESYWDECLALPSKLKDWDAYNDMKNSIQQYLDVFPLLHKLASKEIRNRHWLQVMSVTGSSFQLEANVFKLSHLLDIGLIKHKAEIEEICRCASRELELEVKMRITEEEWTEQVLSFEHYKKRGPIYLDKTFTERLLEQLEDAQALLAQMLTSRYIGPLREEAASWAEKLKEVGEVLEQWLEVQDLWQYLEAVFSNAATAKELPQEAKRYNRIDKGWTKMMKRAYDTRNVLQCCYGGEVPKAVVLRHIFEELEICFKSLVGYLDNKRRTFPRFYFVTDPVLLAILSRPTDLESTRPHLRSIFSAVFDVKLEKSKLSDSNSDLLDFRGGGRTPGLSTGDRTRASSVMSPHMSSATPTKFDKRLAQVHAKDKDSDSKQGKKNLQTRRSLTGNINPSALSQQHMMSTMLPSEGMLEESVVMDAISVSSMEGETLTLAEKVSLQEGVEVWLSNLRDCISSTLFEMVLQATADINNNISLDEMAYKYPAQVCRWGLLYFWTKECEQGVADIKYDRKSLHNVAKRFSSMVSKLPTVLMRGAWRTLEDAMLPIHKVRLENMITQSLFLRDTLENMTNRKLREPTDFEWRRNVRCYVQDVDDQLVPLVYILDNKFPYGCEFYGAQTMVGMVPSTEKCFLAMSQVIEQYKGALVSASTGAGKTETVKGFSQMIGSYLVMFQCSASSDPHNLGKMIQGLAMDGCWGCFDAVQVLSKEAVSVMLDLVQAIQGALKARQEYCLVGDGQEITVKRSVSVFLTMNPDSTPPNYKFPQDLRALFRQVSITKPDIGLVLKAKCSSLGLKSPTVLSTRLKIIADLAKDQLPDAVHHQFSITALTAVLQRASQKRKLVREDKSMDKMEKVAEVKAQKEDQSRSNSQMSMAPTTVPVQYQSSSLISASGSGQRGAGVGNNAQRKGGTPNPMSQSAKMEHAIVGHTLLDIIGPRLAPEHLAIFRHIVKDLFAGLPEAPTSNPNLSARSRSNDVENALEATAHEVGLIAHKPWLEKCIQLYSISQVHQGIIIAGPPGSGKSTIVQSLVDALCVTPRGMSRQSTRSRNTDLAETNHRLLKLDPLVVDDLALMFGHISQNHDWVDGIFTSAWRKANRNQSTTWLCLDGPLNAAWADNFCSVLDSGKVLHLKNGDQLFLSDNVKLLFETDDLRQASPSIVSRAGIVFVDKNVVGWRPIAKAWLENRTQQEVHVLQRAFNKTVDPVAQFVIQDCKPKVQLCEVGMFQTCIDLLSAMLADNIEIGGELHIERLYLFCLIWTFGGILEEKDRKPFSDLLTTLSTALPDDDRDICVFDYYVDESGEWDPWQSRVPESVYTDNQNLLGEVFVDSVDTIRTRLLIDFAAASGQNVLLVGPQGAGKTAMINDFMDSQDSQTVVAKKLVFSGASKAWQLQNFIEANIYHRQGFVYGAKENKKLQVFIDDLNLPVPDEFGVQRCNELLRQMLDDKLLCTLQKPFESRTIEDLTIFSAMSLSEYPSMDNRGLGQRLLRHFAVFCVPEAQKESLKNIVHGVLEANMLQGDKPALDIDLHNALVHASCRIFTSVQKVLRPTPMPGRYHYLFTIRDLITCFQCLKKLADESRADDKMVVSLWRHEIQRIMRDQLCRFSDTKWFDQTLQEIVKETWPDLEEGLYDTFVTFPVDARVYQRPVTSMSKKEVRVVLQPIQNVKEVHNCLQTHLNRYNEEFGNITLNIMLSDNIIHHIIKMHRILSFHHGGNFVLVGPVGSHLGTLCKLALHVADIPIHTVDTTKQNTFFDGLRSAVRLSGAEGKMLTLVFTGRDLHDDIYLDAINSLLVCGEYPHLFSNDEMEGLLLALGPALKREHPNMNADLMKFFVSRVKTNLHIIICMPPKHRLLKSASSQYPGLFTGGQLIWMCDWPQDSLLCEARYYIGKFNLTKDCDEELTENVMTCMANIHSLVLRDCRQTPWAGDTSEEIQMTQVKIHEKKKDQLKQTTLKLPNLPYSKSIMLEHIKLGHRDTDKPAYNEVFVGPTTYRRFMDTFHYIYGVKSRERTETVTRLKKVIATMDQTRKDAKTMKENIKNINKKFETAKTRTADLLAKLTARATVSEKLKAKVGIATALSAFLQLNELSDEEEEEDDLLKAEERDEYDEEFDRMREENLKTRQVQAKEEHADAIKIVEECRTNLGYAREQVLHWKGKVDRQCIERIKQFQNPPALVGHVMEMVMMLIGKKQPNSRLQGSENYPNKEDQSGRFSASSSSTKFTQVKKGYMRASMLNRYHRDADDFTDGSGKVAQPTDKFDRQQWKAMQHTMMDSTKFVDMMHNVPWEDGLKEDVVLAVESYLAQGKDGQLGVTGEGSLLENASDKEKSFVAQRRSPSPDNTKGITIANAKYSSEDAATLVQYTIAIVEYTRLCGPLKVALEKLHELEREIEENERIQREKENEPDEPEEKEKTPEPEEDLNEEDLPRVQAEVDALQAEFDSAVVEKHSLESELLSMNERLKAATSMVESLKSQEGEWRQHVKENSNNDILVANCIAAAAFLTYCGSMNTDTRKRMGEFFMTICEHHGIPLHTTQKLFRNMELIDFLYNPISIKQLEQWRLPLTRLMLENSCFAMEDEGSTAWPLLCDPTRRALDWIRLYMKDQELVEVKYHELRSQLETCLADGIPLLVTDVDIMALQYDTRFLNAIMVRHKFIKGKNPFKIWVGDHEVECEPHFRMYLHTNTVPHLVPHELAAYLSVIYFHQSRQCVEEELLDRFMMLEKSRLDDEKMALMQERLENMRQLDSLEKQMLTCLSSDIRLLNDLAAIKRLAELKKQYDETVESQSRVEVSEDGILRAREGFRSIAQRGAVCFDTNQYLREINPIYQISFSQFLDLYDAAISHSERAAVKAVVERLTFSSFVTTVRALEERDRPMYSLLLALEVEDSESHVGVGEREYLISPSLGSVTMTALGYTQPADSKFVTAKKPFDWMTDDQFHNLQILAIHYEWFQDMFDRMPRDGRETQWRNLCESDVPETVALPDKMDDQYNPLQRLLVVRAVRSDRIIQASTLFVNKVLGKKYACDVSVDLPLVLRQSTPTLPILILYKTERESAERLFTEFAARKQSRTLVVTLSDIGVGEEKKARKSLQKGMNEGLWVLLQNGHNGTHLLNNLETIFAEREQIDSQFRCWITAQATPNFPARVLQTTVKLMVDTPRTMKDNMVRAFSWLDADILKQSSKPEWPAVLHNLCYLHGAIRLRTRYGKGGWNTPSDFSLLGNNELFEAMSLALAEFRDNLFSIGPDGQFLPRNTSWTGLRYMLAEVVYGNFVTDPTDQLSLGGMVDYWISPNAVKKDFEVARLKYKHPAAFFATHPRLTALMQGLENLPNHALDVPEACNFHPTVETLLGDDQYVFTRLNKVFDAMPSSPTLTHQLFPRAPTPFDGPALASISTSSNNPQVVDMGVFASASYAALRMRKEVELWEICHTMLPKVPRAYNKEYITDRIKKIGGFTSFNMYIMKELDIMYKLLIDIKSTLQTIKSATEVNALGDQLSPRVLAAADDLYHMRIPHTWCEIAGNTAPPVTMALASWLTDLANRCQHFERILVLGREKMPAYWLGAFFYPRGLLALLKQECHRQHAHDRTGNVEPIVFQTEITARDKDHLRDPPQEGMFVHGIYIWGCAWEKTTGELQDSAPRHACTTLPVVHVTCWNASDKPLLQDPVKAAEVYPCPVYPSRIASREPIMELDVRHDGIPATRWALRGLSATIRPF